VTWKLVYRDLYWAIAVCDDGMEVIKEEVQEGLLSELYADDKSLMAESEAGLHEVVEWKLSMETV